MGVDDTAKAWFTAAIVNARTPEVTVGGPSTACAISTLGLKASGIS
jgi:hypothetical protein